MLPGRVRNVSAVILLGVLVSACADREAADVEKVDAPAPLPVEFAVAVEESIARFIRVSGTLIAQEEAGVAAEVAGRVVATPIERGTKVARGAVLIRLDATDADAQAREAEANAAQIEARLGTGGGTAFDVERVPEVANARASFDLAITEFARIKMLKESQLVSQSEFDQRQAQVESARRQYEVARNGAEQQFQALMAARARVALARKAVADTTVRAPFEGVVAERLVSVGDYVTRGTRIASVMRIDPLRLELTVPAQYLSDVGVGRTVTLEVDAHRGETFAGEVRYVSPAVKSDSRAFVVEAIVSNADSRLKPGLFATARMAQGESTPAVLVPASAVRTTAGTSRVFVDVGGRAEERIVTTGVTVDDRVEITSGLAAGARVVVTGVATLSDGAPITAAR
ncbi:MAG: efflux RND transporter periplasmic adaptor subunit [Acidobacteriota bacterium]